MRECVQREEQEQNGKLPPPSSCAFCCGWKRTYKMYTQQHSTFPTGNVGSGGVPIIHDLPGHWFSADTTAKLAQGSLSHSAPVCQLYTVTTSSHCKKTFRPSQNHRNVLPQNESVSWHFLRDSAAWRLYRRYVYGSKPIHFMPLSDFAWELQANLKAVFPLVAAVSHSCS